MSVQAVESGLDLLRDLRHMRARAASDLEDIQTTQRYYGRVTALDVAAKVAEL